MTKQKVFNAIYFDERTGTTLGVQLDAKEVKRLVSKLDINRARAMSKKHIMKLAGIMDAMETYRATPVPKSLHDEAYAEFEWLVTVDKEIYRYYENSNSESIGLIRFADASDDNIYLVELENLEIDWDDKTSVHDVKYHLQQFVPTLREAQNMTKAVQENIRTLH